MAKKKTLKKKGAIKAKAKAKSGWPLQRDVLFRPDRSKYVRRLVETKSCVFCQSAKDEPDFSTLCLVKSEKSMIVLNKYPYNSGHLLVLPLAHIGKLVDLDEAAYVDLHKMLKIALQAIENVFSPSGVNLGMNQGSAAGAGIPDHLHYHLIPRWSGDVNFFPLIAETKVVVETLEQTYGRFVEYFKSRGIV